MFVLISCREELDEGEFTVAVRLHYVRVTNNYDTSNRIFLDDLFEA